MSDEITATTPPAEVEKHKRSWLPLILGITVACVLVLPIAGIFGVNEMVANRPLQRVIHDDTRNHGVEAKAHFDAWVKSSVLVIDIRALSADSSRMDIFRTLLQYAKEMKDRHYDRVVLVCRGTKKFVIAGDYFQQLGQEYDTQNPMYTIRTFPLHLESTSGDHPYSEYTGGLFAVLTKEMEQFTQSQDEWYWNDLSTAK